MVAGGGPLPAATDLNSEFTAQVSGSIQREVSLPADCTAAGQGGQRGPQQPQEGSVGRKDGFRGGAEGAVSLPLSISPHPLPSPQKNLDMILPRIAFCVM